MVEFDIGPDRAFNYYAITSELQDTTGVYILISGKAVIYIGKSDDDIRGRLLRHLNGDEGPCTQAAMYYRMEPNSRPREREKELLAAYRRKFGSLPPCNDRS